MTDDIVNSALFYFGCATLDVFFTILVIGFNVGVEANPVWNWIHPKELMLTVCVFANLLFCLFVFAIIPYVKKRHPIYKTAVKCGLYGEGLGRLVFGAIPGILIIFSSGLI